MVSLNLIKGLSRRHSRNHIATTAPQLVQEFVEANAAASTANDNKQRDSDDGNDFGEEVVGPTVPT